MLVPEFRVQKFVGRKASPQSTLLCRRVSSINRGRADQMDVASVVAESKGAVGVNTLTSALGGAGKTGGLPFHREPASVSYTHLTLPTILLV